MLTQVRKFFAASPEVHLTEFVTSIQLDLFHESAADHSEFPQLAPEEEDRQSKPLTWEQLPIEVLIVLSRYLDVFDKIRLSRVCKRWYDIVQDPAVSQYSIVDPSSCRSWYARKFPKEHSFKTNQIKKKVLGGKYTESDLQHGTTWHKYRSELFYYGGIQLSRRMRSLVIRASEEEFVGNRPVGALLVRVAQLVSDGFLQNLQDISLENCSVALWPLVAVIKSETLRRLRMRNITVIGCGYVVDNLGVLRRTIDSWLVDKLVPVEITGASAVMRSMTFWNLVGEKMRRFDPETKQKLGKCWKKVAQNQPHVAEMISLREQPANTTGVDVTTLDFKTFKTSTFRELDCLDRQIQLPSKCKMFFCCLT